MSRENLILDWQLVKWLNGLCLDFISPSEYFGFYAWSDRYTDRINWFVNHWRISMRAALVWLLRIFKRTIIRTFHRLVFVRSATWEKFTANWNQLCESKSMAILEFVQPPERYYANQFQSVTRNYLQFQSIYPIHLLTSIKIFGIIFARMTVKSVIVVWFPMQYTLLEI